VIYQAFFYQHWELDQQKTIVGSHPPGTCENSHMTKKRQSKNLCVKNPFNPFLEIMIMIIPEK
jgi:hypothetical protein